MHFPQNFIGAGAGFTTMEHAVPAPYFRRSFDLEQVPQQAELLICGLGFYELYVNGHRITRGRLAPYISSPDVTVYYDRYQVESYLMPGENVLGVWLGNGFQNNPGGRIWDFDQAPFRGEPRVALELRADGQLLVETDEQFLTAPSPLLFDDYRLGERYDAGKELPGWKLPGAPAGTWKPAVMVERPRGQAIVRTTEPIVVAGTRKAVSVCPVDGGWLYDFGINDAGVCRLQLTGRPGQKITLHHGEHLLDGRLDLQNLTCDRTEDGQIDVYICKGGEETYEPTFTYHGFQYVWVEGLLPEQAVPEALTYVRLHTDLKQNGAFHCSDPMAEQICSAALQSTISNFHHFQTDCPQREKNGWTADAALSAAHTLLYFTPENCYREWLRNLRLQQAEDGRIAGIIPTTGWGIPGANGPAWDCALFEVPYEIYRFRGDRCVIEENAHAMIRYLECLATKVRPDGLIAFGLGDWCQVGRACADFSTPLEVTDTIMSLDCCRKGAFLLREIGREVQADFADALGDRLRAAFRRELLDHKTMTVCGRTQTGQAMALYYGLLEEQERQQAFEVLQQLIEESAGHMDVGVLGGRVLFHVLSDFHRSDLAYEMITRKDYPSYGNWICRGATTLWEEFRPEEERQVTSLNHHFWGNVSQWFLEKVAGLSYCPDGRKKTLLLCPAFLPQLQWAEGNYQAPEGRISVRWEQRDGLRCLTVRAPKELRCELQPRLVVDQLQLIQE